jgi:protein-histidine pros-kinase
MKLLAKFNLVYLVVMGLGIALSGYIARNLLQNNAQQETVERPHADGEGAGGAQLHQHADQAAAGGADGPEFLPQTVPSYSATEVLGTLLANHPEFAYKEATLNPTNPRDRATSWEVDIVGQFRSSAELKETVGTRDTPAGPSLYIARPLRITDPACLACHSSVDAAPATMVPSTARPTASAGTSTRSSARRSCRCRWACRCSAPTRPSRSSSRRWSACSWPSASC